jgi:hypothetical protein
VATVGGGLAVLVASFWLTLKVIDGPQFARTDLDLAIATGGFTLSDAVVGSVDMIQRDPGGRLTLAGWAFDKELAQPVAVLLLVGGKFQQIAVTSGPRLDVTETLKRSPEQTKNIAFTGMTDKPVDCGPHIVVAVNQKKHLTILGSDLKVPRCPS